MAQWEQCRVSLLSCAVLAATNATNAVAQTLPAVPQGVPHGTAGERVQSLFGLLVMLIVAFAIGRARGHRTQIPARVLIWGLILQFIFGAIVVWNRAFLILINDTIDALLKCTTEGAKLVFGNLGLGNNVPVGAPTGYAPM